MADAFHRKAFFLQCGPVDLFAILSLPKGCGASEVVLLAPPFGDEMNKSRRMVTLQTQHLCSKGYAVLVVDLYGTGDSLGDYADATWEGWRENLHCCWEFLQQEYGFQFLHLWGIRLGCLLALDTAKFFQLPIASFLFWQPVISGHRYVTQLFRLRIAEAFGKKANETVKDLQNGFRSGDTFEIGGYRLQSSMLEAIEGLNAAALIPTQAQRIGWFECSVENSSEILPGSRKIVDLWQEHNISVWPHSVSGPQFWNSVEIEVAPELVNFSSRFFDCDGRHESD